MINFLPNFSQIFVTVFTIITTTVTFFIAHPPTHTPHTITVKKQVVHKNDEKTDTQNISPTTNSANENYSDTSLQQDNERITPTPTLPSLAENTPSPTLPSDSVQNNQPTVQPTQPINGKIITAKSIIENDGKTIYLTFSYESTGGTVSGTLSGDCTGSISGTYTNSGNISGSAKATCAAGFLSIPVDIMYAGNLSHISYATISYTISALGKKDYGTTTISLSQ